jgi:hypothetical protein
VTVLSYRRRGLEISRTVPIFEDATVDNVRKAIHHQSLHRAVSLRRYLSVFLCTPLGVQFYSGLSEASSQPGRLDNALCWE